MMHSDQQTACSAIVHSPEDSGRGEGFLDLAGHTDIGEKHELLDQAVRLPLLFLLNIDWLGRLGGIKVDLELGRRE